MSLVHCRYAFCLIGAESQARTRVCNLSKIDLFMLAIVHRGPFIAYRRSRNLSEVAR